MELFLALAFLYGCLAVVPRVLSDAVATMRASKAGKWDFIEKDRARRASRRDHWMDAWTLRRTARHEHVGGKGDPGPGFKRYAGLVMRGFWQDQERKHQARRDMRGPMPVTLRAKWARAASDLAERAKKRTPVDGDKPSQPGSGLGGTPTAPGGPQPWGPPPVSGLAGDKQPNPDLPKQDRDNPNQPSASGDSTAKPNQGATKPPPENDSGGPKPTPMKPLVPSEQERKQMNGTQGMSLGGETAGVVSGLAKAQKIKLSALGLRESTLAQLDAMQKAIEEQGAAAGQMEMDPTTLADLEQAQEAMASAKAALTSACEDVDTAMTAVEKDWEKHQKTVEDRARVGKIAQDWAYAGN